MIPLPIPGWPYWRPYRWVTSSGGTSGQGCSSASVVACEFCSATCVPNSQVAAQRVAEAGLGGQSDLLSRGPEQLDEPRPLLLGDAEALVRRQQPSPAAEFRAARGGKCRP